MSGETKLSVNKIMKCLKVRPLHKDIEWEITNINFSEILYGEDTNLTFNADRLA